MIDSRRAKDALFTISVCLVVFKIRFICKIKLYFTLVLKTINISFKLNVTNVIQSVLILWLATMYFHPGKLNHPSPNFCYQCFTMFTKPPTNILT